MDKYKGGFKDGLQDGKGTYTWANGDKYEGEFKNGFEDGKGTFTWADGDKYEGEWKDGLKHGKGTLTLANNIKYEGLWEKGRKSKGTLNMKHIKDLAKVKGVKGRRHGKGGNSIHWGKLRAVLKKVGSLIDILVPKRLQKSPICSKALLKHSWSTLRCMLWNVVLVVSQCFASEEISFSILMRPWAQLGAALRARHVRSNVFLQEVTGDLENVDRLWRKMEQQGIQPQVQLSAEPITSHS